MNRLLLGLLLALAFASPVLAVCGDLGDFSIDQPRLMLEYSKPVKIDGATMTYLGLSKSSYAMCAKPIINGTNSTVYSKQHLLTPGNCGTNISLQPGDYVVTISAIDASGASTQPNPPDCRAFTLTGLNIELVSPRMGVGTSTPIPITLHTYEGNSSREASCRWTGQNATLSASNFTAVYATMTPMNSVGSTHTLLFPGKGRLQVLCQQPGGKITHGSFTIGLDATAPTMNVTLLPQRVSDPGKKYSAVRIVTDDASVCTIKQNGAAAERFPYEGNGATQETAYDAQTYQNVHETIVSFANITDEQLHNYTYTLSCMNLAGLNTTKTATITVQFDGSMQILSPAEMINSQRFTFEVQTSFEPDACTVNNRTMSGSLNKYSADFALADGQYQLVAVCTGNNKSVTGSRTVTIDSAPPSRVVIFANNSICAGSISARFQASDEPVNGSSVATGIAYFNYTVTDGGWSKSGSSRENFVQLDVPKSLNSQLTWTVTGIDGAGNIGQAGTLSLVGMHDGQDEECGGTPFITLREPLPLGFAKTSQSFVFKVATTRPATCSYQPESGSNWTSRVPLQATGLEHYRSVSFDRTRVKVTCNETTVSKGHERIFTIGRDATKPVVSVEVLPSATIVDRASNVLTVAVTTDDASFCTFNGQPIVDGSDTDPLSYSSEHLRVLDLSDAPEGTKTYEISCKNLAQLSSVVSQNIVIDYDQKLRIDVISPQAYTSSSDVTLSVRPNKQGTCTYKLNASGKELSFPEVREGLHTARLGALIEGSQSILVTCTAIADGERATRSVDFVVDRSTPQVSAVQGPAVLCAPGAGTYVVTTSGVDARPSLNYTLTGSSVSGGSVATNIISLSRLTAGSYLLSVTPTSRSGQSGTAFSRNIEVLSSSDDACTLAADHCTNGRQDIGEESVDCGGTCASACVACVISADCTAPLSCSNDICTPPCSGASCNEENHCANGVRDADETNIDCGADCGACIACSSDYDCGADEVCRNDVCVVTTSCITNADCPSSLECNFNVCTAKTTCTNGIKDENEEALDCGGPCTACVACVDQYDCPSGLCSGGFCFTPQEACSSDASCPLGKVCSEGACVPDERSTCANNADCEPTFLCAIGYCVQPVTTSSCTSSQACPAGAQCFAGVCVNPAPIPLCQNGAMDGDEMGIDCGGSCAACVSCISDGDCNGNICIQGVCVDPTTHASCFSDDDCPGQTCQGNICVGQQIDFCSDAMQDNDESDVDCGGSCAPCISCQSQEECPGGKMCGETSVCVPPPRASCSDFIMNGDEQGIDCGGRCAACLTDEQPALIDEETLDEGGNLLAYLFLAIGLSIMIGAGYFLYEQRTPVGKQSAPPMQSMPLPAPQLTPQMQAKYDDGAAARQEALRKAYEQRIKEKEAARKAVFTSFDKPNVSSQKTAPVAPAETAEKPAERTKAVSARKDPFDELEKINKR